MRQTRFTTVEAGDAILDDLYLARPPSPTMPLRLLTSMPLEDEVSEGVFTIFVERLGDTLPVYTHPNGDVVLASRAYVEHGGEPFAVTVSLPIGESHMVGATVRVGPEMEDIIERFVQRKDRA